MVQRQNTLDELAFPKGMLRSMKYSFFLENVLGCVILVFSEGENIPEERIFKCPVRFVK